MPKSLQLALAVCIGNMATTNPFMVVPFTVVPFTVQLHTQLRHGADEYFELISANFFRASYMKMTEMRTENVSSVKRVT